MVNQSFEGTRMTARPSTSRYTNTNQVSLSQMALERMNSDSTKITFMEVNEVDESAKTLSIAMLNNSLHIAVFKGNGEKQRLKIESMFVDLFNNNPGIIYIAKEERKIVGVMRMKSCSGPRSKKTNTHSGEENEIDDRIKIWHQEWAANDPEEQHWHLGPIGVIPTHQNKGIGSLLMTIFCDEVDKCMAKAFLETDLDNNVSFYEKFGFKVVSTSNIFGIETRYMEREITSQNNA